MLGKSLIVIMLVTLVSSDCLAQWKAQNGRSQGNGHANGHDPIARMTETLQLSESQANQLASIMKEAHDQHRALRSDDRSAHRAIRMDTHAKIAEVLDEQQYAQFEAMREERGSRRGGGRGQGKQHQGGQGQGSQGNQPPPPLDCTGITPDTDHASE